MKIGNLQIKGKAALAPMAGVADRAVRELCMEYGASFSVSELVSAKGVSMGDKKSASLLFCSDNERPAAAQLFGSDPVVMAKAAKTAAEYNPDFIDINMGCPAPKVAKSGGGSSLMKNPKLAGDIVAAVADAVELPVTVKIRTGWDSENLTAVEVAKACEAAGAAAITVHGRTREQMYSKGIDFETIAEVKKAVKIPIIGNGDVINGRTAAEMIERTGCDMVMVGRAALGKPWIFRDINEYFETGVEPPVLTLEQRFEVLKREVSLMLEYKDTRKAILESRKHVAWYMYSLKGAAAIRRMCGGIESLADIEKICKIALEWNPEI